jgi:hypothetical protein
LAGARVVLAAAVMSFARLVLFLFGFLSSVVLSTPVAQEAQWQTATTSSEIANPTACGDIIEASNEGKEARRGCNVTNPNTLAL